MEFIRMNKKKFVGILFLNIIVYSTFWLLVYLANKRVKISEDRSEIYITLQLICGFSILTFIAYFLGGLQNFNVSRRLLSSTISLKFFDDDKYSIEYVYKKNPVFYTRECAYGKVDNYPVIIFVLKTIGKHPTTDITFYFFIVKFNKTRAETISVAIENNRIPENINERVSDFLAKLKAKGYIPGNISNGAEAADMIS